MGRGLLFLAVRHARFHQRRTLLLAISIALCLAIPLAGRWMSTDLERKLLARAEQVPLVVGGPGSATDLVTTSLYFRSASLPPLPFAEAENLQADQLARVVPVHREFTAHQFPIVGTSLDYFPEMSLSLATGRMPTRLGDCVLGAEVARQLQLSVGEQLLSDARSFLNPAGQLPLSMRITGVLQPAHGPDDQAVFVDLKTCWLIAGIGHGHMAADQLQADQILQSGEAGVKLNANVQQFLEVTDDNQDSFHFHGDMPTFPVSAYLIFPTDERSSIIWEGRQQNREGIQVATPSLIMRELLALLVNVRQLVDVITLLLGLASLLLLGLQIGLSLQLRHTELATFQAMGAGRSIRLQLIGLDLLLVLAVAVPLTLLLSTLVTWLGQPLLLRLLF